MKKILIVSIAILSAIFVQIRSTAFAQDDAAMCAEDIMSSIGALSEDGLAEYVASCLNDFPDRAEVRRAAGYYQLYMGDPAAASAEFAALVALDPENIESRHQYAYALLLKGDKAAANEQAQFIFDRDERYETPEQVLRVILYFSMRPPGMRKVMETSGETAMAGKSYPYTTEFAQDTVQDEDGATYYLTVMDNLYEGNGMSSVTRTEVALNFSCSLAGCSDTIGNSTTETTSKHKMEMQSEFETYNGNTPLGQTRYLVGLFSKKKAKTMTLENDMSAKSTNVIENEPPSFESFPAFPGKKASGKSKNKSTAVNQLDGCFEAIKTPKPGFNIADNIKFNVLGKSTTSFKKSKECSEDESKGYSNTEQTFESETVDIVAVETPAGRFENCLK
ncbi:MAG TPA: hypothetical protein PLQ76_01650, partial [bacterium]|nr:hypothetical protein [bacterium]